MWSFVGIVVCAHYSSVKSRVRVLNKSLSSLSLCEKHENILKHSLPHMTFQLKVNFNSTKISLLILRTQWRSLPLFDCFACLSSHTRIQPLHISLLWWLQVECVSLWSLQHVRFYSSGGEGEGRKKMGEISFVICCYLFHMMDEAADDKDD